MIKAILIGVAIVIVAFIGVFLYGWWILNHEQPTDIWIGKPLDED